MTEPAKERTVTELVRCSWAGSWRPKFPAYHDDEWGGRCCPTRPVPELSLEAFQSGLSWLIIPRKRPAFGRPSPGFGSAAVASFGADDVAPAHRRRHRPQPRQIEATIHSAGQVLGSTNR